MALLRRTSGAAFARLTSLALLALPLAACEPYPRDPQDSLRSIIASGTLDVGLMEAPPWVEHFASTPPQGVEVELLKAFARELGVEVRWHRASMEDLFDGLKHLRIHVVAAGLTTDNPWKEEAAFTLPYYITLEHEGWRTKEIEHVMALTQGENALVMRLERFLLEGPGKKIVSGAMEEGKSP